MPRLRKLAIILVATVLLGVGAVAAAVAAGTDLVIVFDTKPNDPTNSTSASFTFHADEGDVTFECQLDTNAAVNCNDPPPSTTSGSFSVSDLSPGLHTLTVTGSKTGKTGTATHTWTIDTTPPTVTITNQPTNPSNSKTATFEFARGEEDATFTCWVDDDQPEACTSPYPTRELADGPHTFHVEAKDAAGNTAAATYDWTVDATPPTIVIRSGPDASTTDTSATFTFDVDEQAGVGCSLDGSEPAACTSPATYSDLAPGSHSFVVKAVDAAGNTGSSPEYQWSISPIVVTQAPPPAVVDATPPDGADPIDYFVSYRYLELTWTHPSASDFDHVTVFARSGANGSRVAVYSGAATSYRDRKFNNALDYRYEVISYDHAGNAAPAASVGVSSSALLGSPRRGTRVRRPPALSWAPISGARFYNVQLFRNGRKVMSTWPRRPRVQLAPRWRYAKRAYALTRGRYDWYVWPALRSGRTTRYGPPLGHSFFRR
jgi:hypothetical protein